MYLSRVFLCHLCYKIFDKGAQIIYNVSSGAEFGIIGKEKKFFREGFLLWDFQATWWSHSQEGLLRQ